MKNQKITNCGSIRNRLYKTISDCFSFDSAWVQRHIENCPKCQKRFASLGKVYLAISLLKSRPHRLDLLRTANIQAIDTLAHSVRGTAKADKLRIAQPEPKIWERLSPLKGSLANTAACIAILFFVKTGIFNSMAKFQTDGRKAVENYCQKQVGQDISDEIFS
jgi:anti-sigma factor RsiW